MRYRYNDYIETVSTRFKTHLDEIATVHHFEYGDEYEVAICRTLSAILPERFGICRGFVVTADGQKAGNDIIIYARDRFPVLRLMKDDDYSLRQQIPVEAVYAYIEAKHTLILDGKGEQSLHKAGSQVAAVKALPREPITVKNAFHPYIDFTNLRATKRKNFPQILNPFFGAIIARNIKIRESSKKPLESSLQIRDALNGRSVDADLLIAGGDVVCLPFIDDDQGKEVYHSPFAIEEQSKLVCRETPGLAFAVGICSLLLALDTIILGHINWRAIIADSLGIPLDS